MQEILWMQEKLSTNQSSVHVSNSSYCRMITCKPLQVLSGREIFCLGGTRTTGGIDMSSEEN